MQSRKLETMSKRKPTLAPLIEQLEEYLNSLENQNIEQVVPRVAAAKLHISEADALALLGLFQEAGVVRPRYDLVCLPTRSVLSSYYKRTEIPDTEFCKICGTEHDCDGLRVELVFEIVQTQAARALA